MPKNDPAWKGPWDCAEFVSWLVFQEASILYGCTDDTAAPAQAEAYTGAWKHDVEAIGRKVSVEEAAATVGEFFFVIRRSLEGWAISRSATVWAATVEAKGRRYGVVADTVQGRRWHTGVLIPDLTYDAPGTIPVQSPASVYEPGASNMDPEVIRRIQKVLTEKGYHPGDIDGEYGPTTEGAVIAFQEQEGLTVDGAVGPETAEAMGISLVRDIEPAPAEKPIVLPGGQQAWARNPELLLVLASLLKEKSMATNPLPLPPKTIVCASCSPYCCRRH